MSSPAPFEPIADLLARSLSIKHVYGEPVQRGDTTIIPVAQVAYGFGAGGGRRPRDARSTAPTEAGAIDATRTDATRPDATRPDAQGAGGGGGVRMTPVGALEIGPQGTRFIPIRPFAPLALAAAVGILTGWLVGRRS